MKDSVLTRLKLELSKQRSDHKEVSKRVKDLVQENEDLKKKFSSLLDQF